MRVLAALFVFVLGVDGGVAQEVRDPLAGRAFARELCAICHAVEGDFPASPNPRAPSFQRIAAEPGMTATALFVILQNPHREMPDLILSDEERRNVVAYILTLDPRN
jgi:mono/diheme cytochrome c family protein